MNKSFKSGFTLAEVLITLGIIGVVAAMTLPSLIQKHQDNETAVKLKKVYSILSQFAIQFLNDNTGNPLPIGEIVTVDKTKDFVNNCILNYFKTPVVAKNTFYKSNEPWGIDFSVGTFYNSGRVLFKTSSDGIIYQMLFMTWQEDTKIYTKNMAVYVDLNGTKGPNKRGKDIFLFYIDCEKGKVSAVDKALEIQKNNWKMP